MPKTTCPWCTGSDDDEPDYDTLCLAHQAEYEGLSINELERRDREQYAEWFDATYG